MRFHLNALGLICAAGADPAELAAALWADQPRGVQPEPWRDGRELHLGRVRAALPALDAEPAFASRNNALLGAALQQIRPQVDAAIARH
ncbi:MAG: beta-ketoacyl-[acyl-carrier-protein] synthase II, partial [Inhella sp.]